MNAMRRFDPSVPAVERDPATRALLAATPPERNVRLIFGSPGCPPGEAMAPDAEVCWRFAHGATETIEQLSLGDANVWLAHVVDLEAPSQPPADREAGDCPWLLRDLDFRLFVFPIGIEATFLLGEERIALAAGAMAGKLDFFPNGESTFVPTNRSYAVRQAFTVFERIFAFLAEPQAAGLSAPAVFMADSQEPRMIDFVTRRLGMRAVAAGGRGQTAVGAAEVVRAAYEASRATADRLSERAERERRRGDQAT